MGSGGTSQALGDTLSCVFVLLGTRGCRGQGVCCERLLREMRFSNYLRTQSFPEDDGDGNKLPEEPGLSGSPGMRPPPQSLTLTLRKQQQWGQARTARRHPPSVSGLHLASEEQGGRAQTQSPSQLYEPGQSSDLCPDMSDDRVSLSLPELFWVQVNEAGGWGVHPIPHSTPPPHPPHTRQRVQKC